MMSKLINWKSIMIRMCITAAAIVLLSVICAGLAGCSSLGGRGGTSSPEEIREETPLPVVVSPVARGDMSRTLTLGGLLKPQEEVALMGGGRGQQDTGDRRKRGRRRA